MATIRIFSQENPNFQNLLGRLSTYVNFNTPEKVYLQTDKDFYTNGETIWFKAYVLNGITHLSSKKSNVVYVDLLDPNDSLVAQRKLYSNFSGASGDIQIAEDIDEGNYQLRAYTQYMLNGDEPTYFQKELPIWAQNIDAENPFLGTSSGKIANNDTLQSAIQKLGIQRPIVQFFPEGGDLVVGLESSVGLKVTDADGNGIALEGKIIDQEGNIVAPFRSFRFGLGVTRFTPRAGKTYYARIPFAEAVEKYQIPKPLATGYVLQVRNKGDHILLQVTTNTGGGLQGTMLLGHLRGDRFFEHIEKEVGENTFAVKLLTAEMHDGVAQFTLFMPNGEPVCERLTFIDNPSNDIQLSIATDKKRYRNREEVEVAFEVADSEGKPITGNFSMAVVAENSLDSKTPDIKSWLLLDSDLGGTVENPGYFFEDNSNARKYLLDVLMLTHGWRRFIWKDLLVQKVTPKLDFPPEKGIMITGSTTAFNNRYQPKRTLATLSLFGEEIYHEKKETNLQGRFNFGPLIFQDTIDAVINAVDIDEDKKNKGEYAIYVDPPAPKINVVDAVKRKLTTTTIAHAQHYLETAYRKKMADFKYDPGVTELKEVVVEAKKKTRQELIDEEINSFTLYGDAQNRLFPDSIPGTGSAGVIDLLRRVAGVQVLGDYPEQRILIRGVSTFSGPTDPLFLIDGTPVDAGFVQGMRANEVMFVDVLKGAEAAIYGSRASNGVVAVYTHRGLSFTANQERYPNVTDLKVPGFYKVREFYSPDYTKPNPEDKKPDYRSTLYWEPDILVKGRVQSVLKFYAGDSSGKYRVKVEGISNDGRPVRGLYTFDVTLE